MENKIIIIYYINNSKKERKSPITTCPICQKTYSPTTQNHKRHINSKYHQKRMPNQPEPPKKPVSTTVSFG